jgi:hypothetical protein
VNRTALLGAAVLALLAGIALADPAAAASNATNTTANATANATAGPGAANATGGIFGGGAGQGPVSGLTTALSKVPEEAASVITGVLASLGLIARSGSGGGE